MQIIQLAKSLPQELVLYNNIFFIVSTGTYFQRDSHQPTKMPTDPDQDYLPPQPGNLSLLPVLCVHLQEICPGVPFRKQSTKSELKPEPRGFKLKCQTEGSLCSLVLFPGILSVLIEKKVIAHP